MKPNKKKLDLFLKICDFQNDNVRYFRWDDNVETLLSQIDSFKAHDLIVLTADDLSDDRKRLNTLLDLLMIKRIRILSVLDRIEIHSNRYYLSRYEKALFVSAAVSRSQHMKQKRSAAYPPHRSEHKKEHIGIYCRVSTREQTLGYSIENQKAKNLMYLELFDYSPEHVEFYIDDGQSAASLDRKDMRRMLEDVKDGKLDEIIIYKLDRLTRNVIDTYELVQMFLDLEVNLIAVLDNLDIHSANGRMILGILAIFAQWERETIIERTNDGQLQMAAEGKYPKPGCPLGYSKDKDMYLSVDDSTAKIVKDIFKWAKSYTFVEIQKRVKSVYELDLRIDRIRRVIFEDGYYGEFLYKDIVFPEVFPALISKEESLEARKMSGKRAVMYGKEQNKFYYRNKVKCSCCGEIAIGIPTYKSSKRYYYYYCKGCNKRINQDVIINESLYEVICRIDKASLETAIQESMKKIERLEAKLKRVTRQYAEDLITDDAYILVTKELDVKIKKEKGYFGSIKIVNGAAWSDLSDEEKRKLIESAILTMTVDFEKKRILDIEYE
ncbi:recombinase family protein [[Clostridium] innocuum]|nr:recombinase family protein [[Clostridium] innocuum]MCR0577134.1 recombinase family protein [[Clostridium] innocuum]